MIYKKLGDGVLLESQLKRIVKKFKLNTLITDATDNYYDHISFSVTSLSEFIALINAFALLNDKSPDLRLVYRGCSNFRWKLEPSLVRRVNELPMGYGLEHDLAVDFRSEIPELFANTQSNFEKIAKMQHFGIPTRLLDFSLNPLVALYFACAENPRTYGRVVFSQSKIHHFDDPCVECTSSLYLCDDCSNIKVDDWIKPYNISVSDYLFHTFTDIHMSSPMFVKPLYLDDRMKAQRSVFLLFNNYVRDVWADRYYYNKEDMNQKKLQYENVENFYREQIDNPYIHSGDRSFFVLDKCSFGRLTDFYRKLDLDNFLEKIDEAFSNRFFLQEYIQPLDMEDIWFNFSSIIIPPKCKKTILTQLENIGVDEAYVYPEAEYLARRIKKLTRGI